MTMNQAATTTAAVKPLTYCQSQALKVLAADKMGLNPQHVDDAQKMMRGCDVHPMTFASVEHQATQVHNELASDPEKVEQANHHVKTLLTEYGLA